MQIYASVSLPFQPNSFLNQDFCPDPAPCLLSSVPSGQGGRTGPVPLLSAVPYWIGHEGLPRRRASHSESHTGYLVVAFLMDRDRVLPVHRGTAASHISVTPVISDAPCCCSLASLPTASTRDLCVPQLLEPTLPAKLAERGWNEHSPSGRWECMDRDSGFLTPWTGRFPGAYSPLALSGIELPVPTVATCLASFLFWLVSWDHCLNKLLY